MVTGGAGFIGSHTVEQLVARGADVLVLDDMSHPCGKQAEGAEVIVTDCGSEVAAAAIRDFKPDAVLHLASKGGVQRAARNPRDHVIASLASTIALYDASVKAGAKRIVTASSGGTVYGDSAHLPASESDPAAPLSAYGAAKRSEEVYLSAFGRRFGVSTLALRYGNVYGPRQDGTGEAGLVAITCHRLLGAGAPEIFGDGRQSRDFVYVGDVAQANVAALESERSGEVNIATGRETTVNDVVGLLQRCAGTHVEPAHRAARDGEVRRVCLDITRASGWLAWKPATPVEKGLELTWSWFRDQRSVGANVSQEK